jgi:hypothetical protein
MKNQSGEYADHAYELGFIFVIAAIPVCIDSNVRPRVTQQANTSNDDELGRFEGDRLFVSPDVDYIENRNVKYRDQTQRDDAPGQVEDHGVSIRQLEWIAGVRVLVQWSAFGLWLPTSGGDV